MSDSFVQLASDALNTGKKVDATTTTAGDYRQVIVNGDPVDDTAVAAVTTLNGLQVDVTKVVPGTGATNLGKAEDGAHTSGDVGILSLGVRRDADTSPVSSDGDYHAPMFDALGNLKVNIKAGAGSGGTAMADDAPFTIATTSFTPVGGTYKSTLDAVDDGDGGTFAMTAKRALYVSNLTPNGDSMVDDTIDAINIKIVGDTVGSTVDTEDGTIATGQANIALAITQGYEYDGTNWSRVRGGHSVAHDSVDAGNPDKLGAVAKSSLSAVTLVSADDRTNVFADIDGVLLSRHCPLADIVSGLVAITDGSSTSCVAAQGAGVKMYVTDVICSNSSATDVTFDLRDGTGGTVKATFPAPSGKAGVVMALRTPLPFSSNTAVAVDPSAAASTVTVTLIGFKSKV